VEQEVRTKISSTVAMKHRERPGSAGDVMTLLKLRTGDSTLVRYRVEHWLALFYTRFGGNDDVAIDFGNRQ